jgi:hypothetical protein
VKRKLIEKRITIGFSKPEIETLEAYCNEMGRSYADVIRECVRNLAISSGQFPSGQPKAPSQLMEYKHRISRKIGDV